MSKKTEYASSYCTVPKNEAHKHEECKTCTHLCGLIHDNTKVIGLADPLGLHKQSVIECVHACNCALPAMTGSTECCKNCVNRNAQTRLSTNDDIDAQVYAAELLGEDIDLANDESHFKDLENERYNRPSWEETFFEIAKIVAKRSKDPHTKVGAVIVKNGHILGIGYNGEPRNFTYNFDWHSKEKYDYVIHAELNAIANACAIGANVAGSDIFLTLSPCHDCMKLLIQHQIKRVYFLEKYNDFELTQRLAEGSGISLIQWQL